MRSHVLLLIALGLLFGCSDSESAPPSHFSPPITGAAVRAELTEACRRSDAERKPVLVEFSAPWCSDCQRLQEMKQERPLAKELDQWPSVMINVGRFDIHRDLLDHFDVEKIANWSIFQPSDCEAAVETWPRLITRTLEPSSGAERDTSPAQLAQWLRGFRRP